MEKKKSILLVEDDFDARQGLKEILCDDGWDVREAEDGDSAIGEFERNPSDLVMTDLKMPKLDGMGLLYQLLGMDPKLPIIVITGFGTIDRCREALNAGATDFLAKPAEPETIIRVLERALERRREKQAEIKVQRGTEFTLKTKISADLGNQAGLVLLISELANISGFEKRSAPIRLALHEAFTNSVIHGAKSNPSKMIEIQAVFGRDKGLITIRDPGEGFDYEETPFVPTQEMNGRGVFLIRAFCDEVNWRHHGTECEMVFHKNKTLEETKSASVQ